MLSGGFRFGPYEIVSPLGAGGMGEVYRARDTKLGREVAIKVLPPAFTSDPQRLARFEREGRMLAALNHPNIATIHGVEENDGARAIVMELVNGNTLAERLGRISDHGAFAIAAVLPIAVQLADALDAAHTRGIIHRDLKPTNIAITTDGIVKVLDFGLAKVAVDAGDGASQLPTGTFGATQEGIVVGTAAYMSPEQARGLPVDKRADIWAFGCVLYEMLTGRPAFLRESLADTLAAVINAEPNWHALPATLPASLQRVLRRCLEKEPKRRLRDIGDARIELEEIGTAEPVSATPRQSLSMLRWTTAAMILLASAAAAAFYFRSTSAKPLPTAHVTAARLTSYAGQQNAAAIAPDGRSFVFVSDHGGTPDIWLRQVAGGEPVRVTNDSAEESELAFSPDGESIYYTRADEGTRSIWRVGTLGGQPHKTIPNAHAAAVSPDGSSIAYMIAETPAVESLVVSAVDGANRRTVAQHIPWFPPVRPAWAPDGSEIAFVRAGLFAPANLIVVDARSGKERQVTNLTRTGPGVAHAAWLPDGRHIVISYRSSSGVQAPSDLAIVDAQNGSISRVTTVINESFQSPGVSRDGSRVIATSVSATREVWRVPLKGSSAANGTAPTRILDSAGDPMWTFVTGDGRFLLFNGTPSGSRNLWLAALEAPSKARQITTVGGDVISHASLSPDGTRVAFVSLASGSSQIWTQNVDGSDLRQITSGSQSHAWPVWSPDGQSLVFTAANGSDQQTWIALADGRSPRKFIDGFFRGDWATQPGSEGTWIVTSDGVASIKLIDVERGLVVWNEHVIGSGSGMPTFSPDRRFVAVPFQQDRDHDAIATIDVTTRERRVVAVLPFHVIFRASWIEDGTALLVNRADTTSHVVLFDHFWESDH